MTKTTTSFRDFLRCMHDPDEGNEIEFDLWLEQMDLDDLVGWAEAYRTDEMVKFGEFLVRAGEGYVGAII